MIEGVKYQVEDLDTHTKEEVKYYFTEPIESKNTALQEFYLQLTFFLAEECYFVIKSNTDVKNIEDLYFYMKDKYFNPVVWSNFEFI